MSWVQLAQMSTSTATWAASSVPHFISEASAALETAKEQASAAAESASAALETAKGQASAAAESASAALETAKGQASAAAESAREQATAAAENAKEQASAVAETASVYFSSTISRCQQALADLSNTTQDWKDASGVPAGLASAFEALSQALADLKQQAHTYDTKYQLSSTVTAAIADTREQANVAVAAASSYAAQAAAAATAQLVGVSAGLKVRILSAAEMGLQTAIPAALSAEEKLQLAHRATVASQKVQEYNTKYGVYDKLRDLEQRYSLTEHLSSAVSQAQGVDQRVTGGKVEPAMLLAYETGLSMVGHVIAKYEEAKQSPPSDIREEAVAAQPVVAPEAAVEEPQVAPEAEVEAAAVVEA